MAGIFNIDKLKSQLTYGGSRPALFNIDLSFPSGIGQSAAAEKLAVTCEAASLPGSQIGIIRVPYFGREIPYAGLQQFQPWDITVINDEDFLVRNAFEQWLELINGRYTNIRTFDKPTDYKTIARVHQYSQTNDSTPIKTYKMTDVFPIGISPIETSWADGNSISRFRVSLEYTWFEPEN